jgi:hypothetical protein
MSLHQIAAYDVVIDHHRVVVAYDVHRTTVAYLDARIFHELVHLMSR